MATAVTLGMLRSDLLHYYVGSSGFKGLGQRRQNSGLRGK